MTKRLLTSLTIAAGVLLALSLAAFAAKGGADFPDVPPDAWYADAAAWAASEGIIGGYPDRRFGAGDPVTREQLAVILWRYAGSPTADKDGETPAAPEPDGEEMPALRLGIGGQSFTATLEDNETTRALLGRLPITVTMGELNGNEKYYFMGERLPTNAQNPGRIEAGDLMLYGDDCLVLFYESFSTAYRYTRLGRLDNITGLAAAVGDGGVNVTIQKQ